MSLRRISMLVLASAVLALTGCASHRKAPDATFDEVGRELRGAMSAAPRPAEASFAIPPKVEEPPAKPDEPRFDLAVSNAPAAQVFMALVSGTNYSMMLSPDVSGTVSVNLKNVTVREVLESLRDLYGYEFSVRGTRIHIQSNTLQTRIFQINYLAGKRQGQTDVRVTSGSISAGASGQSGGSGNGSFNTTPSSQVMTSQESDFWRDLADALSSIVGTEEGRSVVVNAGSGMIVVKAFPKDMRSVETYLRMTQAVVERQVMLEAKILEVSLSEGFRAGVNWAWLGGRNHRYSVGSVNPGVGLGASGAITGNGVTTTPGRGGSVAASEMAGTELGQGFFGLALQAANFASLLDFLETQGSVQVLSSPRIATLNNQKAVLKVGTDDFFVTNVSTTTTSSANNNVTTPTINLQPFFSGIALDVTPQIDGENGVVLHLHPSISNVTENQKVINLGEIGQYTLPLASSTVNETDSIVRVQDGNIVAIGGLMRQEQGADGAGLPGTTSSAAGWLFGSKKSYLQKSELVILIKPTIIRGASSWKDDLGETEARVREFRPRAP